MHTEWLAVNQETIRLLIKNACKRWLRVHFLSIPPVDASLFLYLVTIPCYNKKLVTSYVYNTKEFLVKTRNELLNSLLL